ncbi:MAG: O-antigen ligase family protein [Desulfobulbaceae bacterium]|nr:O-antigen ligase family protein [Desulfobulbaceae bacterium]
MLERIKRYNILSVYYFSLFLIGISLPISETAKQIAIILIFVSGFCYFLRNYEVKIVGSFINFSVLMVFISNIISAFFAKYYYDSLGIYYDYSREFHAVYAICRVLFIFIIIRYLPIDEIIKKNFLLLLIISYLLSMIIGEYNIIFGLKKFIELKGIGHVNHSAIYSCMIFFVSLNLIFFYEKKYLFLISLAGSFFSIVQSGSRSTAISCFVTLLFYLFYRRIKIRHCFYVISLFVFSFLLIVVNNNYSLQKMKLLFHDPARIFIWRISVIEWFKHNIIFGIGPNNSYYINPLEYGKILGLQWKSLGHSHNTFLTVLLETGLFGLFSYLVFTGSVFLKLIQNKEINCFVLIALCVAILNFVNSFANTTFDSSNAELMVILWAMALNEPKNTINGDRVRGKELCAVTASSL